jgi:hypothetical protein
MSNYVNSSINLADLLKEPGATGILSNYSDHTDPKYIGPGTWNVIHRIAFISRTHDQQLRFIILMTEICHGFPCIVCKGHCTEYIKNHPMEEYLDISVDINGEKIPIGMFVWSWKFHNAVNSRIKKPVMNWDTAYNLYSEKESLVCSKNCLEADGIEYTKENLTNSITTIHNSKNKFQPSESPIKPFYLVPIHRK